jgi:hypothetical protein
MQSLSMYAWGVVPDPPADHPKIIRISSSQRGKFYDVNLTELTCECEAFKDWHCRFPGRDVRRACRHIAEAVARKASFPVPTQLIWFLLANQGHVYAFDIAQEAVVNGEVVVMTYERGKEWVNVFAGSRPGRPWKQFGYALEQQKWSYGRGPVPVAAFVAKIREWNPQNIPSSETVRTVSFTPAAKPQGMLGRFLNSLFR